MQGMFKNPLVLALLASVLLNGVLIGKAMSPKPDPQHPAAERPNDMRPRSRQVKLENLPRHLTPEQRLKFDVAAKASGRADVRAAFKELRAARRNVINLAAADPLDRTQLRAAMQDARTKAAALAELSDEAIATWLETADTAERQDAIKAMKRAGRRGGKGKRGDRGPKPER